MITKAKYFCYVCLYTDVQNVLCRKIMKKRHEKSKITKDKFSIMSCKYNFDFLSAQLEVYAILYTALFHC